MSQIIGTTIAGTASDPTGLGFQNHLMWATNDAAWWLFFSGSNNNTIIQTYRSSDGVTWTSQTASPILGSSASNFNNYGRNFGLAYKNISAHDVVHCNMITTTARDLAQHIRATISSGAISWGSWATTVDAGGSASGGMYPGGFCTVLDSNNRPVDAINMVADNGNSNVERATNTDSGTSWTAGFGATVLLETVSSTVNAFAGADTGSGNVLLCWSNGQGTVPTTLTNVDWSQWTGSSWSAAASIFTALGTGIDPDNFGFCAVTTSDVHCILGNGTTTFTHKRFNGTNWTTVSGATIPSQSYTGTGIALASDGTNLWMFVIDSGAGNAVKYIKWTAGSNTWDGAWSTLESSSQTRNFISCSSRVDSTASANIGVIWTQTNGSNFDVVFAPLATIVGVTQTGHVDFRLESAFRGVLSRTALTNDLTTGVDPNNFGAASLSTNDIHLVVRTGDSSFSHVRFNGTDWTTLPGAAIPAQTSLSGGGIALSTDGSTVWMFIIDSASGNAVKYITWNSLTGTWDSNWTTLESSFGIRKFITCSASPNINTQIGISWTQSRSYADNYEIVFKTLYAKNPFSFNSGINLVLGNSVTFESPVNFLINVNLIEVMSGGELALESPASLTIETVLVTQAEITGVAGTTSLLISSQLSLQAEITAVANQLALTEQVNLTLGNSVTFNSPTNLLIQSSIILGNAVIFNSPIALTEQINITANPTIFLESPTNLLLASTLGLQSEITAVANPVNFTLQTNLISQAEITANTQTTLNALINLIVAGEATLESQFSSTIQINTTLASQLIAESTAALLLENNFVVQAELTATSSTALLVQTILTSQGEITFESQFSPTIQINTTLGSQLIAESAINLTIQSAIIFQAEITGNSQVSLLLQNSFLTQAEITGESPINLSLETSFTTSSEIIARSASSLTLQAILIPQGEITAVANTFNLDSEINLLSQGKVTFESTFGPTLELALVLGENLILSSPTSLSIQTFLSGVAATIGQQTGHADLLLENTLSTQAEITANAQALLVLESALRVNSAITVVANQIALDQAINITLGYSVFFESTAVLSIGTFLGTQSEIITAAANNLLLESQIASGSHCTFVANSTNLLVNIQISPSSEAVYKGVASLSLETIFISQGLILGSNPGSLSIETQLLPAAITTIAGSVKLLLENTLAANSASVLVGGTISLTQNSILIPAGSSILPGKISLGMEITETAIPTKIFNSSTILNIESVLLSQSEDIVSGGQTSLTINSKITLGSHVDYIGKADLLVKINLIGVGSNLQFGQTSLPLASSLAAQPHLIVGGQGLNFVINTAAQLDSIKLVAGKLSTLVESQLNSSGRADLVGGKRNLLLEASLRTKGGLLLTASARPFDIQSFLRGVAAPPIRLHVVPAYIEKLNRCTGNIVLKSGNVVFIRDRQNVENKVA